MNENYGKKITHKLWISLYQCRLYVLTLLLLFYFYRIEIFQVLWRPGVSHSFFDLLMALTANKVSSSPILTNRATLCRSHGSSSPRINRIQFSRVRLENGHLNNDSVLNERSTLFNDWFRFVNGRNPVSLISKTSSVSCKSTGANNTEEKECVTTYDDVSDLTR